MFNNKIFLLKRFGPIFFALLMTAVTMSQPNTVGTIIAGIQIIINRQPQGF